LYVIRTRPELRLVLIEPELYPMDVCPVVAGALEGVSKCLTYQTLSTKTYAIGIAQPADVSE
jgi:hypothetical protein